MPNTTEWPSGCRRGRAAGVRPLGSSIMLLLMTTQGPVRTLPARRSGDVYVVHDLVDGGDVVGNQGHRFVAHRSHALLDGEGAHLLRRGGGDDQLADLVGHCQHFVDADALAVPGVRAVVASGAVDEAVSRCAAELLIQLAFLWRRVVLRDT